jgi:saccharopine dehydrogenase-like NADP-dependent oxidoreductase
MSELRVLVVGGYGTFGGRIVALLEDEPRLTLIVAGRSLSRAEQFVRTRRPRARLEAAVFDRNANVAAQLAGLAPAVVVDASGPFQSYGYGLVEACIAARIRYLDLADGSDFVAGVGVLDAQARAAGVFCLAGASSFPTLTAAVVRRLAQDLQHVDTIRAGIAPLPSGGVGENVIRAIAS